MQVYHGLPNDRVVTVYILRGYSRATPAGPHPGVGGGVLGFDLEGVYRPSLETLTLF